MLAVTFLCNSHCVHCDLWKTRGEKFLSTDVYRKLPRGLRRIDLTGGEPFLRPDVPEIVAILRQTTPQARLLITTHGFMVDKIAEQLDAILAADPEIAFRVSLDGLGEMHDRVRGITGAFGKATTTLRNLKQRGVKDVGIIHTLLDVNRGQLANVYEFAQRERLNFSLNLPQTSDIYYGTGKDQLNSDVLHQESEFNWLFNRQIRSFNPTDWAKAWFNRASYDHWVTRLRPFACGAGEDFVFINPRADVYVCQIKPWKLGNLAESSFEEIWKSDARAGEIEKAKACQDCWMMCTARDAMERNKGRILAGTLGYLVGQIRKPRSRPVPQPS